MEGVLGEAKNLICSSFFSTIEIISSKKGYFCQKELIMVTLPNTEPLPQKVPLNGTLILIVLLISILTITFFTYFCQPIPEPFRDGRLKMEKNSGRNGKHANPKTRESAQQQYEKAKQEFEYWDKKPNKTPNEKEYVKKLRKLVEHLRKKKDFTGENHSQKYKGN